MCVIYGVRCNDETTMTSWWVNTRYDRNKFKMSYIKYYNILELY